jgi:hypothetical protein
MPVNSIRGPESEDIWGRASSVAKEQYPGLKSSNPHKFYAIVMTIYKQMCSKHKCEPKNESMAEALRRVELMEGNQIIGKVKPVGGSMYDGAENWVDFVFIPGVKALFSDYRVSAGAYLSRHKDNKNHVSGPVLFSFDDEQGLGLPSEDIVKALLVKKFDVDKKAFKFANKGGKLVAQVDLDFRAK